MQQPFAPSSTEGGQADRANVPDSAHACFWCGDGERSQLAVRNDGVPISICLKCGHKAVSYVAMDLEQIYQSDAYFTDTTHFGYDDYGSTGISNWSAELLSALLLSEDLPHRSVLDIGCATGRFLDYCKKLGFQTLGIEPCPWAQEKCRLNGHDIVSGTMNGVPESRIPTPTLLTAYHVVEHIEDVDRFFQPIAQALNRGSRFLAVFPNVDFDKENWSGKNSSYEHVSYFDPKFVTSRFGKKLGMECQVLYGPDLIFVLAGKLCANVLLAIAAVRLLESDADSMSNADIVKLVEPLSVTAMAFVVVFLCRNHSASRALKVLTATKSLKSWSVHKDWYELCDALISLQNGNVYGCAQAVDRIPDEFSELSFLKEELRQELRKIFQSSAQRPYPRIAMWAVCGNGHRMEAQFLEGVGAQTYPNIELLHIKTAADCKCRISECMSGFVKTVDVSRLSGNDSWSAVLQATEADVVCWTDCSYKLSDECLFLLYDLLQQRPHAVFYPETDEKLSSKPQFLRGQRKLERMLNMSAEFPGILLFDKNKSQIAPTDVRLIGKPKKLTSYLLKTPTSLRPEVLATKLAGK